MKSNFEIVSHFSTEIISLSKALHLLKNDEQIKKKLRDDYLCLLSNVKASRELVTVNY